MIANRESSVSVEGALVSVPTWASQPDLLVVGGGITGAAVARDAAGRGYRVILCERGDLGGGTTSRSSRLAHGGLRYLEHYQFRLVREALRERDRLLRSAPTRVASARFQLPLSFSPRHRMTIRAGLLLYDALAGARESRVEADGFSYVDAICEPERLTADLAADAATRGALIRTYTPIRELSADGIVVTNAADVICPRAIILCAGPWTDRVLREWNLETDPPMLAPTRGTHLLLDVPLDAPRLLQADADGRVFFAVPWQGGTLVGTTDQDDTGDPAEVRPHPQEIAYLRDAVRRHLPELVDAPLRGAWTGIRPLVRAGGAESDRSRSELVAIHPRRKNLILVAGGKLTTMRLMAERAVNLLERRVLDRPPRPWTATAELPASADTFAIRHLSDLLLRRTGIAFAADRGAARASAEAFARERGWDSARLESQWRDFAREAETRFGLSFPVGDGFPG